MRLTLTRKRRGVAAAVLAACLVVAAGAEQASRGGSAAQELELAGTIPVAAGVAAVAGDYAYLAEGPTLRVDDISDPAAARAGGSATLPANIYDIDVAGSVAYVAMDFDGLATVDVSDPAAPRVLGTFRTPGQALSVSVSGTLAAVTNRLSGLELVDVSDPAAPAAFGSYFAEGYAIDVAAGGDFAYVVDTPGGLSVVDLAAPGEDLEAAGSLVPDEQPVAVAVGTARRGGREIALAALMSSESTLTLVDVTDPAAPSALASFRDPERPRTGAYIAAAATGGLVHVVLAESLALLGDAYPPFALQAVDLSDPAAPAALTTYALPGPPRDVAVSGSRVLVAVGGPQLGGSGDAAALILRLVP